MAKTDPAPAPPARATTTATDAPAAGTTDSLSARPSVKLTPIRVRAFDKGYYGDVRRRIGDVFDLVPRTGPFSEVVLDKDGEPKLEKNTGARITREVEKTLTPEEQFNKKWMEKVEPSTPTRSGSGQEEIDRQHDAILASRATRATRGAGVSDPPTGAGNPLGED